MPGWGTDQWGTSPWGGSPLVAAGNNAPVIVLRSPPSAAVDVVENALVSVGFADFDLDLDTATTLIEINGIPIFTGLGGFISGYVGNTSFRAGRLTVQFIKLGGWGFDTEITVRARIADLTSKVADDTWRWRTRADPVCYSGLTPLAVELSLQNPMTKFLNLEPARQLFFNNALQIQTGAVLNRGNKAARVLYQEGFSTEISTILNPFAVRNTSALSAVVCERQRVTVIDKQLQTILPRIQEGLDSLFKLEALPKEYRGEFTDYLDSTMYKYRVSLVANMLMLARLVETTS